MIAPLRRGIAVAFAVVVTVAVAALSRAPYAAGETQGAAVRLAWRVRSARVEECRQLTPAERANLPTHMRREEVCEGRVLPYRLVVTLDGRVVADELVRAAGARADRPLFVFHEFPVAPGPHDLRIRFEREQPSAAGDTVRTAEGAAAAPALLELAERVALDPLDVALVVYDPEQRALILRGSGNPQ